MTKWLQQKNPKAIDETYQYIATSFSFPTRIAPQGIRNTLDMVAQRNLKVIPQAWLDDGSIAADKINEICNS